jgi:hypothetical protein
VNRIDPDPKDRRVLIRDSDGNPTWWPVLLTCNYPEGVAPNDGGSVGWAVLTAAAVAVVGVVCWIASRI